MVTIDASGDELEYLGMLKNIKTTYADLLSGKISDTKSERRH